jgi:hypothetical protein
MKQKEVREKERSGEFVCNKCRVKFTVEHEISESGALCNKCFKGLLKIHNHSDYKSYLNL